MKPKSNFTLLHDKVMIYPIPKTTKTAAGIIVTEKMDPTAPLDGIVVAAGPGRLDKNDILIPMPVKAGDRVIFIRNAAKEIKHSGDTFLVVPVSEILCIVDAKAE
jgi:chaperonin GroES